MSLQRYGIPVTSVFGLNGTDENSATYAIGWVLAECPTFASGLLRLLFDEPCDIQNLHVELQRFGQDKGYTDVEIRVGSDLHVIIEAKRYWELPSEEQLSRYKPRLETAGRPLLVSVSAASSEYAQSRLPAQVDGIELEHIAWSDLHRLVDVAYHNSSRHQEKFWLQQLSKHLASYSIMQDVNSNHVYVVSLSSSAITEDDPYTWLDVVQRDRRYFHPVGNNWPVIPPNYVGFRYSGMLQSVHHVDDHRIVTNVSDIDSRWPVTTEDHFVYTLGPAMTPAQDVKNGRIWPSGRYWCAIDTLLSGAFSTIAEARDETNRRQESV